MFDQLTDLKLKRTNKQAIGFYLAYFLAFVLIGAICGALFGAITGNSDFATGLRVGQTVSIILCLALSIAITMKKNQINFKAILLILLSGVLASILGALGGLIPIAFLTKL
ncbi:MAG: hypothetical protein ACRDB1_17625 [Microcoleaceae cyanobacterium]